MSVLVAVTALFAAAEAASASIDATPHAEALAASRSLKQDPATTSGCEDADCVGLFEQCAGVRLNSTYTCCDPDALCTVKDFFFAQCLLPENAAANVEAGWDGRALACDEDLPGDLDPTPSIVLTEIDLDCEGECAMRFDACYNVNMTESLQCCQEGTSCIVKDKWYAQCLATEDAEMNINMGWDGRELDCEPMPEGVLDIMGDDAPGSYRRLLDTSTGEEACEDDMCKETWERCGGGMYPVSVACCDPSESCVVKNKWYAQCITAERAKDNMENEGWDGRTLMCEEMPESTEADKLVTGTSTDGDSAEEGTTSAPSVREAEVPMPARRLLDTAAGYGGSYGSDRGMYGSTARGMGTYGTTSRSAPADTRSLNTDSDSTPAASPGVPTGSGTASGFVVPDSCDECLGIFEQCAGMGTTAACCEGELVCTKKNNFYAQCLFEERAARNTANFGWDGAALECGDEVTTPDEDAPARRRLLDTDAMAPDTMEGMMGDDMMGEDGTYGERMTPAAYGDGTCDVCAPEWYQCGGGDLAYTACCEAGLECVQKNAFYAQCLGPGRAADNAADEAWDGVVLACGSLMPSDMKPAAAPAMAPAAGRRLLQGGAYGGYGSSYGGAYGAYGGYGSRSAPSTYGNGDCTTCLGPFFQCGGGSLELAACCGPGLACVQKNADYAQCLSPDIAARNVEAGDWDGTEVDCGSALTAPARRLLDAPGDDDMAAYADDDAMMGGSYGSPPTPAFYGNGDCDVCVGEFYQCGGGVLEMTACCAPGLECVQKNEWYAQCLGPERAEANVNTEGWDGSVLACGSLMPSDMMMPAAAPAAAPAAGRRLQQAGGTYGGAYGGAYGGYGAYGQYGAARGYGY